MGEVFAGRYELVDPIGRGGVGAVWRSWDHRRRRYVAAKVLQQSDAHALLRFVREQAMRIDHPHVLAPASWSADDDKVLFTMDLVHGGSLSHLSGDYGPLPPRFVCVLLDQLLAGLTAVHAEGIVHRDIKPANILLEATGTGTPHVRLSDFGIAMRKGDARLTETDYVVGTPGYFAPEQLRGDEPDFPADLYAVGLVALYLLSGRKPDAQAVQERFLAMGMPPAPLGVPDPLWQVVGALLQPDPHARFRTATGARKALAAATELMPEPGPGEEPVEVFDQIGPLPDGFGPDGPQAAAPHAATPPATTPTVPLNARPADLAPGQREPLAEPPLATPPRPRHAGLPVDPSQQPAPAPDQRPDPRLDPQPAPAPDQLPDPRLDPYPAVPFSTPHTPEPPAPRPPTGQQSLTHTRTRVSSPAPPPAMPLPQPAPAPLPTPATGATGTRGTSTETASARLPARRPAAGPPARAVVTILVLALICFVIGFVALAAS